MKNCRDWQSNNVDYNRFAFKNEIFMAFQIRIQNKWPKKLPVISEDQEEIRDKFIKLWHEILPNEYGFVENFNHTYPLLSKGKAGERVLEIGAGIGEHLNYEISDWKEYICVELRAEMAHVIRERFPKVNVVVQDCQTDLPFEDNYFDRVLAIHVLEHLPDLPSALHQIRRVLKPHGFFSICIPCEGGIAYRLAREISAKRIFKKHFPRWDYEQLIVATEHINRPQEILDEILPLFKIVHKRYFPFWVPSLHFNLIVGGTFTPQK
jgi:SAM-dependent methyltransferase